MLSHRLTFTTVRVHVLPAARVRINVLPDLAEVKVNAPTTYNRHGLVIRFDTPNRAALSQSVYGHASKDIL